MPAAGRESDLMPHPVRILEACPHSVARCEISSDGSRLLTWSNNVPILWGVKTGRRLALLGSHGDVVRAAAFSHVGSLVITVSRDSLLHVWDARSGARVAAHPIPDWCGEACTVTREGDGALLGGFGCLKEVDLERGDDRAKFDLPEDFWVMTCAYASPGGRVIAVDGHKSELALWDPTGGKMAAVLHRDDAYLAAIAEVNDNLHPHQYGWCFTSDGRLGIARFFGGHKVFDTATGTELAKLIRMPETDWEWHPRRNNPSHITADAVSPAGSRLAVAYEDGALILWDLSGAELWRKPVNPDRYYANYMAFSADGTRLFTAAITGPLAFWDTDSGRQLAACQDSGENVSCSPSSCVLSADGKVAACGRGDGSVILWDLSRC